jgi:hypothetical protein
MSPEVLHSLMGMGDFFLEGCNPLEGVKKLAVCASARKDGCPAEALGRGSSHVMGNHSFQ